MWQHQWRWHDSLDKEIDKYKLVLHYTTPSTHFQFNKMFHNERYRYTLGTTFDPLLEDIYMDELGKQMV